MGVSRHKLNSTNLLRILCYTGPALKLVWRTSPRLTLGCAVCTVVLGLLPGAAAFISKLMVDAVLAASKLGTSQARAHALQLVGVEAALVIATALFFRMLATFQSILRELMGERVQEMILEKALTLRLPDFENSTTYNRLTQAHTGALSRPMSLAERTFSLLQSSLSLVTYAAMLVRFSPWAVLVVALGGLPPFVVEAFFSRRTFHLFKKQSEQHRQRDHLQIMLAREDYAKEVKLFRLGVHFLARFKSLFTSLHTENRELAIRRNLWGFGATLLTTGALYGAYLWVVMAATHGQVSLGEMTMYLLIFRQGQSTVQTCLKTLGGVYNDNLYLSGLYEFLEQPVSVPSGDARRGEDPLDGVRFENVSFRYPGGAVKAVDGVSLHLRPGDRLALVGVNGSGKTTLIKLLTRLYEPTEGRILLDGTDVKDWDIDVLRSRVGVIFQDFIHYQFPAGTNIGVGDVDHISDECRWAKAAARAEATSLIDSLSAGFQTQLGTWFFDGQELSGGQWQKLALARAFMNESRRVLVLDEPTSALDAEAEARILEQFRKTTEGQVAIIISHRFSTLRVADQIVVLEKGKIVEQGSHAELIDLGGRYSTMFENQAQGYR